MNTRDSCLWCHARYSDHTSHLIQQGAYSKNTGSCPVLLIVCITVWTPQGFAGDGDCAPFGFFFVLPLRVGDPLGVPVAPPPFPSLQSGGNRVLGSPKWYAIFTTLCSIWGLLPGDLLQAALPKPRNLTLGQLSPEVMENIWPAAWLQGLVVRLQCYHLPQDSFSSGHATPCWSLFPYRNVRCNNLMQWWLILTAARTLTVLLKVVGRLWSKRKLPYKVFESIFMASGRVTLGVDDIAVINQY